MNWSDQVMGHEECRCLRARIVERTFYIDRISTTQLFTHSFSLQKIIMVNGKRQTHRQSACSYELQATQSRSSIRMKRLLNAHEPTRVRQWLQRLKLSNVR